jgi:hypothetical protein
MHTTTKTAAILGIGKPRLYKMMTKLNLQPVQHGRSKLLTEEMLETLRQELQLRTIGNDTQHDMNRYSTKENDGNDTQHDGTIRHQQAIKLAVVESQLEMLKEQLSKTERQLEKTETLLQEERTGRDQLQQMLAIEQTERRKVTQQLLESPKASPVEETIYSDVEPTQYNQPRGGWFSRIFAAG